MLAAETNACRTNGTFSKPPVAWKQLAAGVDPFLVAVSERLLSQVREFEADIAQYAEYALAAQGKQLRPILVALSAEASGKLNDDHVTVATIIEMVHLATLVHDDVIDEAELRRGKPTLAANWGNELSVLLGDCLFAHSLKLAASFPTPEICRAVASATNTVCTGEILQLQQRWKYKLARPDYFKVLAMKTAELFSLSCDLGALLSRAPELQREALRQFGTALGIAYQVYDDCLDMFGSERKAGKSLGTDLANGKITLPLLVVLERATEFERVRLQNLIEAWDASQLPFVLELMEKYDALNESRRVIAEYLGVARENLSVLPLTEARVALTGLTDYLSQQVDALEAVSQT